MEEFYERHSKQKALAEATGKKKYWKMPEKSVVMPCYSKLCHVTLEDQRLKQNQRTKA